MMVTAPILLAAALFASFGPGGSPSENPTAKPVAQTETHRFALVIGSNHAPGPEQEALRYADDDAARMAELLRETGFVVELVTAFDEESQRTFAHLADRAESPAQAELWPAYERLLAAIEAAEATGASTDLVVFYSGHGDIGDDGQPYLTLRDGKLGRADLFDRIVARSPADYNHLIIDACQSEGLVLSRGAGERAWTSDEAGVDARPSVEAYVERQHLETYPNLGVLLAHSGERKTHEWARYRAGVFSHEILSGLRGGADLNGDGRIEYSELGAFVSAANSAVHDPRARLEVEVLPPRSNQRRALVRHDPIAERRTVMLSDTGPWHYVLEDARGVRLADLRRSDERPAYLRLPPGELFVYRKHGQRSQEAVIPSDWTGTIAQSRLQFTGARHRARGALDSAFSRGLFQVPFGPGYYFGYTDRHGLLRVEDSSWKVEIVGDDETVTVERTDAARETDDEDGDEHDLAHWGSVYLGTVITPFRSHGPLRVDSKRVISDRFDGCLAPLLDYEACSALRGFELRWQWYWLGTDERAPDSLIYVRTGYMAGRAEFDASDSELGPSLSYLSVPLFVGGNIYLFERFPLRPFAGLGFGFDILRLDYENFASTPTADASHTTDVSARLGFELHAGLEARITKYVTLNAEVRQQWSLRRKLENLPDFSNEGFTIVTGVAVNFGLTPRRERRTRRNPRKSRTTVTVAPTPTESASSTPSSTTVTEPPGPAAAWPPGPEPEAASDSQDGAGEGSNAAFLRDLESIQADP